LKILHSKAGNDQYINLYCDRKHYGINPKRINGIVRIKFNSFYKKKISRAIKFLASFLRQRSYDSFFNFNVNTVKAHRNSNVEYTFTTDKTKLL
jgi:hypothetical protein